MDVSSEIIYYPTVNENDKKWGLYVTTTGFQSVQPKEPYPTQGHPKSYTFNPTVGRVLDEYQLLYITRGKGTFASRDHKKIKIEAGMIILLFPDEWHTYIPKINTGWDQYWIGFKGIAANRLVANSFFDKKNMVFKVGFLEQLVALYDLAIEVAKEENASFQQYLAGTVMHMLGLVHYTQQNNLFIDNEIVVKINQARFIMQEYPTKVINPRELADQLNMSYSYFRKNFKKFTGLSPTQYQLQIKIQKAKEYLTSSSMPIKEISDILHFDSVYYFTSFFKSKTKETPAEFRNRVHNVTGKLPKK